MNEQKRKSNKKRIVTGIWVVLIALLLIFEAYVTRYYHADATAEAAMASTDTVQVVDAKAYVFFDGPGTEIGYIYYPGGKVEAEAYAPLLHQLAEQGVDCFLVKMPFRLAFFGINRADAIRSAYEYPHWYIGGHSLGGAMAAYHVADQLDAYDGTILMAAYPTKSLQQDGFSCLSFYGSNDQVLNMEKFQEGLRFMPKNHLEAEIAGGNHAQFGNYGVQKGDGTATITTSEQQDAVVEQILAFVGA